MAIFFTKQEDFREWLQKNHEKENEIFVGYYKIKTKKESMTWSQSVDQALCFGWIDGVRNSINTESYQIRFTKRKENSIWSAINIKKIEELKAKGLMQKAGLEIYNKRKENKSKIYSYEIEEMQLTIEFENKFKSNLKAWEYFNLLAPNYKKTSIYWVMSAKQESTKIKRLLDLINDCENKTNKWKNNKYKK